jgi:hypothetical protein
MREARAVAVVRWVVPKDSAASGGVGCGTGEDAHVGVHLKFRRHNHRQRVYNHTHGLTNTKQWREALCAANPRSAFWVFFFLYTN